MNQIDIEARINPLDDPKITDELRQQLIKWTANDSLVVKGPNVAAVIDHRSEHGSSGGIGYWSQVCVFYGTQAQMKEWQWRDRYSASNDTPEMRVHGIGEIEVTEETDTVTVKVELINEEHGNRTAVYTFKPLASIIVSALSLAEQATFAILNQREMDRVMAELMDLWKAKPHMNGPRGQMSYDKPRIKECVLNSEIGVAAFVTEEQIDHCLKDRQMRCVLYVQTATSKKAERKAEDHGYNKRDGGALLTILEVEASHIAINTSRGKSTIPLS